jgi:DNA-binding CsgD family transcriptional regulator
MLVSRPSLRRSYSLLISPSPDRFLLGSGPKPTVAIFVSDPDAEQQADDRVLTQLFGLTAAESRVAVYLMQGKSLEQASEHFGVTRNTLRSQFAQILSKTGTHRQSELIHFLSRSVAALSGKQP